VVECKHLLAIACPMWHTDTAQMHRLQQHRAPVTQGVRGANRQLTISSGLKIPNCTFFTCLSGADESLQKFAMLQARAPCADHLRRT